MCGIVAIYSYRQSSPPVDRAELLRIRDRMTARGPDGCGEWYSEDGKVGMGHRRLYLPIEEFKNLKSQFAISRYKKSKS